MRVGECYVRVHSSKRQSTIARVNDDDSDGGIPRKENDRVNSLIAAQSGSLRQ